MYQKTGRFGEEIVDEDVICATIINVIKTLTLSFQLQKSNKGPIFH